MNKNKELLDSFIAYCEQHPEERFWQALGNWSELPYILAGALMVYPDGEARLDSSGRVTIENEWANLKDTFYWENKNN